MSPQQFLLHINQRMLTLCSIIDQKGYEAHITQWTWREEKDQPFAIQFERSQGGSIGVGFTDWIGIRGERDKGTLVTLQGASGRRMKIRDPEEFLEEVMHQQGLEKRIRKHASITHKSKNGRHRWKAPELWMVTGVQYVTGGDLHFENHTSSKISGEAGGDLGLAVGAPPGVLKAKAEASREKSNGAQNDFSHEDERVWAAQFMPVKIEFGPQEDPELSNNGKEMHPKTILQFQLEDVPDLTPQGFRVSQEEQAEEPVSDPPELVGRITIRQPPAKPDGLNDANAKDPEGLIIDDMPYVAAIQTANWEMYDECSKYLTSAERSRNLLEREQNGGLTSEPVR